jgi:hypothetical protein
MVGYSSPMVPSRMVMICSLAGTFRPPKCVHMYDYQASC